MIVAICSVCLERCYINRKRTPTFFSADLENGLKLFFILLGTVWCVAFVLGKAEVLLQENIETIRISLYVNDLFSFPFRRCATENKIVICLMR